MSNIVRGTTPTITFTITRVAISDITAAYLTIKQDTSVVVIEKDLSDATTGENSMSWDLTQNDTLAIDAKKNVSIQIRYKTSAGKAYASKIYQVEGYKILKDGVI